MNISVLHAGRGGGVPNVVRSQLIVRRCYEPCQPVMPHRDLREGSEGVDARSHLHLSWCLGKAALLSTPDRGNIHGAVRPAPGRSGEWLVARHPIRGFRGPYSNGCYVFTEEAP